jgi:hypothetical protein
MLLESTRVWKTVFEFERSGGLSKEDERVESQSQKGIWDFPLYTHIYGSATTPGI